MRRIQELGLLVAIVACFAAPRASANCNVIPGATSELRAALGSVDQPFASPGDRVEVRIAPPDPKRCDAASPGLLPNAQDHLVTIVFTPPSGPASAILVSADPTVPAAALASCQAALGAGRVFGVANQLLLRSPAGDRLAFPFPDSDAFALPANDLRGFTGPAKIAISSELATPPCAALATGRCQDVAGLIACVDELYESDGTCEVGKAHRHATFGHFTALPIPNDFQALCDTANTPCVDRLEERVGLPNAIRFATDADGNVLWPVDFSGVRVGGSVPIPRLVSGVSSIGAFDAGGAPVRIPSEAFLGSYSPDGNRLPPVFNPFANPDGDAELFGSVDAPRGVLRLARRSPEYRECLGGAADGAPCTQNADCPGATCGATSCRFACDGGTSAGDACVTNADCPGSTCGGGRTAAIPCANDLMCPASGECGPGLFDFRGRQDNLVGPVVIPDASFDVEASNPVPLDGLAQTDSIFLEVRSEPSEGVDLNGDGDSDDAAVVTVRDRATGELFPIGANDGSCGAAACPGRAVPRVRRLPYTFPAAAAEGDVVAFLEAEQLQGDGCASPPDCDANGDGDDADTLLRVYRSGVGPIAGDPALPASQQIAISTEPLVGGKPIAISNGVVFYRSPEVARAPYVTTLMPPASFAPGQFSFPLEITPDARFVLFHTDAVMPLANLPGGDTNGVYDAFVLDRDTDEDGLLDEPGATKIVIVSITPAGVLGNADVRTIDQGPPAPHPPGLSANGRWVTFATDATNLGNGPGIYVSDRDGDGDGVYDESGDFRSSFVADGKYPTITDDGRYVAFLSAQALVPGDTNGVQDAYVYDRTNAQFFQIGRGPGGAQLNGATQNAMIAAKGEWIAIETGATNVDGAPAANGGVYAVNLVSTRHAPMSVRTSGELGTGLTYLTRISADGRYVSMTSFDYLGGIPGSPAAYLRDRDTDDDGAFDEPGAVATIQLGAGATIATGRVADDGRTAGVGFAQVGVPSVLTRLIEDLRTGLLGRFSNPLVVNAGGPTAVLDVLPAAKGKSAVALPAQIEQILNGGDVPAKLYTAVANAPGADANADGDIDDTLLFALDTNATSPAPVLAGAAGRVEVAEGRAAFLAPENGDLDGSPAGRVQLYRNGAVEDLGLSAEQIALSRDWLAALVDVGDPRGPLVHVFPVTSPGTWVSLDLPADQIDVRGDFVAFLVSESAQNASLNGDGDTADRVLHFYDARHQQLHNTGLAALDFVLGETLLAFRVSEAGQANSVRNADGDALDAVLHVIDLAAPDEPPINTQQAAIACPFEACDGRLPYRINGDTVTFLTREEDQSGSATAPDCVEVDPPAGAGDCDLNGDGDPSGVVLQHFNAVSMMLQAGAAPATSQFAGAPAGVCTDSFESCLSDAQCASGSCFVAPGLCLRSTGVTCSLFVASCATGQFCRPTSGGNGVCHEIGNACEALDSCSGSFFCAEIDQDLQRLVGPISPAIADGAQVLAGAGQCLLDQGAACAADDDCAVEAFCSAAGRCVRQTGTCDADADCVAPAACSFELVSSGDFDADGDTVANSIDNCPNDANADQSDVDGDGVGDRCDLESCGDGFQTYREQCDDGNTLPGDGCSAICAIEGAAPACSNGLDDDGDGAIDFPADGGCTAASDTSERRDANDAAPARPCDDGADNDGDLLADWPLDPGCLSPASPREDPACSDGVDSDGDGVVDAADAGCADPSDRSESFDCSDGLDNDGDGQTDFPADTDCASASGPSEARRCSNGLDDDGDGALDFPADPGCASASDDDERSATVACDDGVDNDGDGAADFPADPGCASLGDPSESAPSLVCDNGLDDDGDGRTDFPLDPGCDAPADTQESSSALQCDDGSDRDGDGLVDLADPDCSSPSDPTEWRLDPGDILVTDNTSDRLLRVRPATGVATVLYQGAPLLFPMGVLIDANGEIAVYDFDRDALYRFDTATGTLGPFSIGGLFGEPRGAALDPDGNFVFADSARDGIFRVDARTGAQQLLFSSASVLPSSSGVAAEASGSYLVADFGTDQVVRIPATGGSATVVSSGQNLSLPRNLVIEPATGQALVVDSGTDRLIRIDPNVPTAPQVIESQAQLFSTPWGLGIAADGTGDVFVSDNIGRIVRVDLDLASTANQTQIASGLGELRGLAVVPTTQCSDGADNDGDGLSDLADPDCSGALDRTEFSLEVGDAVVSTFGAGSGARDGRLVRVRASNGAQTRLTNDPRFLDLEDLKFDGEGRIVVADFAARALHRFDPVSGRVETLSKGGILGGPRGVEIEPGGGILVADATATLVRIDPEDGAQAPQQTSSPLNIARGLALEPGGDLLVTRQSAISRVDLPSGTVGSIFPSSRDTFFGQRSAAGTLFYAIAGSGGFTSDDPAVRGINSTNGNSVFSVVNGSLDEPHDVEIEASGTLLVTSTRNNRIVRIAYPSSTQTTISSSGQLNAPFGIALVRAVCADGLDNDRDGTVDFPNELGCSSAADATETDAAQPCNDGVDNDGDGLTDYPEDSGCASVLAARENPQCSDGIDNDGDGGTDWNGAPKDANCKSPSGTKEKPSSCGFGAEVALMLAALRFAARRARAARS